MTTTTTATTTDLTFRRVALATAAFVVSLVLAMLLWMQPADAAVRVGLHSASTSYVTLSTRQCGAVRMWPGQSLTQRCGVIDSVTVPPGHWGRISGQPDFTGTRKLSYWSWVTVRTYKF